MALFRKFFYRKPPDGLLEISERVYVFDCCFSTDVLEEDNYKVYMGGIVEKLREHLPEASFMVFNFREGERQSQIASFLSEYDMTVMDYPRHYEGCPVLTMEVIHHFMRSSESWLSLGHHNVLLMHCERGGWPVLAFMLAALLVYRKQYTGEQRTLDMIYKQAPHELMQLLSPLDPLPSQVRYLHYVSRRNVAFEWPPLDRALTLDCIILRILPDFNGEGGCRPIFRIYGQDPFLAADRTPKVLFSTPKTSKIVRLYKQADCELVKIDINCHIQGDVVLECVSLDEDLEREEMMFRVMFNTAFIRSNILMLNRDQIDILWNTKDRFPKDFRAEVLLSEMDSVDSHIMVESPVYEEKDGLPMEAFSMVNEIFNSVDWLDPKGDIALNVLQKIKASNSIQEKLDSGGLSPDKVKEKLKPALENLIKNSPISPVEKQSIKPSSESLVTKKMVQPEDLQIGLQLTPQSKIISQRIPLSSPVSESKSPQSSPMTLSRYHSAPSALGITALLHDHATAAPSFSPPSLSVPLSKSKGEKIVSVAPLPGPEPPPPPPRRLVASTPITSVNTPPPTPPPPPQQPHHSTDSKLATDQLKPFGAPPPPPPQPTKRFNVSTRAPPPPPPPLRIGSSPSSSIAASTPPPPPPPLLRTVSKSSSGPASHISPLPPAPPPPAPFAKGLSKAGGSSPVSLSAGSIGPSNSVRPPTPAPPLSAPFNSKGHGLHTTSPRNQQSAQPKKTSLKPLHWLKLTRAMQGSLWAEAQKTDEASKGPEFDMSELESLFSAAGPNSDRGNSSAKSNRRVSVGLKPDKVQLVDLRRAYNCEIMLTKVKIPLPDLMGFLLALDDSALDVDQVDNLIKFCPTKEEMDLLKGYNGDKENLGKCEQFFLELMKVPRVESKLRVFSFKIQLGSQVSDLRKNLNVVNSASEEIRNSAKLKRIMQTILSLGNALNQGTARGSAIGFRLDSLLKLTDTRARNNKMTLMHYLCKVLADKLPELLDFQKDLVSLEAASKIQLKYLAEEMQAISRGLEKVEQELTASENDGPVSKTFCKTLNDFLVVAEADVRSLASLYSGVGRSADALALYFGEDPARCPFEQVVTTLLNFVKMFVKAHEENCKQIELEKRKAQKEAENEKMKVGTPKKETEDFGQVLLKKTLKEKDSEKINIGSREKESGEIDRTLLKQTQKEAESEKINIGTPKKDFEKYEQAMLKRTQIGADIEKMKKGESEKVKIGPPKKESEIFGQTRIKNANIK